MSKVETLYCMGCMSERGGDSVCPRCGYDPHDARDETGLAPGTVLEDRYLVGALKGRNGQGMRYIGYDNVGRRKVWIHEYFPETLSSRDTDGRGITPHEGREAQYKALLSDFLEVCDMVRQLEEIGPVIPLEGTVQSGNTVYAVYSYLPVISLESYLANAGGSLPFDEAVELLSPLFTLVGRMHISGEIHRGLSPYTIYIDELTAKLYLGDFLLPPARTAGSELGAELYNGYSAPEQYASNGWQGTWTDVYALGAILYRTVSGIVPPKATLIGPQRPLSPLVNVAEEVSWEASEAVSAAMRADSQKRTQTVTRFLSGLLADQDNSKTAVFDTVLLQAEREEPPEVVTSKGSSFKYVVIALLGTVIMLGIFLWIVTPMFFPNLTSSSSRPGSSSPSVSTPISEPETDSTEPSSSEPPEVVDVTVPDFTAMTIDQVEDNEEYNERFRLDIRYERSDIYLEGRIYDQAPSAGTPMPNRGTVILYVSEGPASVEMPDLVGLTIEEAAERLYNVGREVDVSLPFDAYDVYEPGAEAGTIVRTSPAKEEMFLPSETNIMVFVAMEGNEVSESVEVESSDSNSSSSSTTSSR